MTGDNKVWCEKTQQRVTARLRTCLSRLPKLLVLHLKRFDFNLKTMSTEKVNSRCSFPKELDLHPFTKWGAPAAALNTPSMAPTPMPEGGEEQKDEGNGGTESKAEPEDREQQRKGRNEAVGSEGGEEEGEEEGGVMDPSSSEAYSLVGVLLHSGNVFLLPSSNLNVSLTAPNRPLQAPQTPDITFPSSKSACPNAWFGFWHRSSASVSVLAAEAGHWGRQKGRSLRKRSSGKP